MNKVFIIFFFVFIIAFNSLIANGQNYNVYTPQSYTQKTINNKERILFIVDFSNSMEEKIEGKRKIDIALESLEKILPLIPPDIYVGMRVYGHKSGMTYFDSCKASSLVAPVDLNNVSAIQDSLSRLTPQGATPIAFSLKQAVSNDFGYFTGKKRIILLTDGGENCDESPCEYALRLIRERNDFKIDVIAMDINDKDAYNQLKCVALATSGKFYCANTSAELLNSFQDSLNIKKEVQGMIIP